MFADRIHHSVLTCCVVIMITSIISNRHSYRWEASEPIITVKTMEGGYVDTHFHVWNLQKFDYPWPTPDLTTLYKNYTATDLSVEISSTPVKYAVFVQCLNGSPQESKWVLTLAEKFPFIKGVVGGIDLTDSKLEEVLDDICVNKKFVGVRHILDMECEDWIVRDDVIQGLKKLQQRGLTYDLLLRPHHLKYIPRLAAQLPNLKMVVDHIAKPYIKKNIIDGWKEEIAEIAKFPNIYCKISGLVPEGEPGNFSPEHYAPFVQHILDVFGPARCMYGSDWPVMNIVGGNYKTALDLAEALLSHLTPEDRSKVFRDNAIKFYNLDCA